MSDNTKKDKVNEIRMLMLELNLSHVRVDRDKSIFVKINPTPMRMDYHG
jgi:hypothetical protein